MRIILALALLAIVLLAWLALQIRRDLQRRRCIRCGSGMPRGYGAPLCLVCRLDDEPAITALAPTSDTPDADRLLTSLESSA